MYRIIDDKVVALLAVSVLFVAGSLAVVEHIVTAREENQDSKAVSIQNIFGNVPLEARAAVVYDIKNKEFLFEKNPEIQMPLASLTKIMTAYAAGSALSRDEVITVNTASIRREGDSGLKAGERFKLGELLKLTLVHSLNDGAIAVANAVEAKNVAGTASRSFVDRMNDEAKTLGLNQTYFVNADGLDYASTTSGGYGSAHDMAILATETLKKFPDIFEATAYSDISISSLEKRRVHGVNTNKSLDEVPGLIVSKTGYTDLSSGNLVVIFDVGPEHPTAVVVLGSSIDGRFRDVEKLVNRTLQSWSALSRTPEAVN